MGKRGAVFQRNRIGICVLHPIAECAGQPCRVEHSDGKGEAGMFPKSISPWQPFYDVRKIWYSVAGVSAQISLRGMNLRWRINGIGATRRSRRIATPQKSAEAGDCEAGDRVQQSVT